MQLVTPSEENLRKMSADELAELAFIHGSLVNLDGTLYERKFKGYTKL